MEEKVTSLISEHFGIPVSEISSSMELKKDLNATDLELADFLQIVEHAFQINISKDDALEMRTVEDLVSYVTDHAEETS